MHAGTFANEDGVYIGPDGNPVDRTGVAIGPPGTRLDAEGFIVGPGGERYLPDGSGFPNGTLPDGSNSFHLQTVSEKSIDYS